MHLHIWQVYQKVMEFEQRQREISSLIYDAIPQIVPEYTPAGSSQNLLNDRQAVIVGNDAINVYQSVIKIYKQQKVVIDFNIYCQTFRIQKI